MSNISLSPHFCLDEFTKSATARSHGINNEPVPEHVENLKALCVHTLEPLREALRLRQHGLQGFDFVLDAVDRQRHHQAGHDGVGRDVYTEHVLDAL